MFQIKTTVKYPIPNLPCCTHDEAQVCVLLVTSEYQNKKNNFNVILFHASSFSDGATFEKGPLEFN